MPVYIYTSVYISVQTLLRFSMFQLQEETVLKETALKRRMILMSKMVMKETFLRVWTIAWKKNWD